MQADQNTRSSSYILSISIIGALFFIFGFVTWLNGVLIPFLKISCELSSFQAYFVTTAFYMSYFFMAFPASIILSKTGFKNGMSLGLVVMAVGSLIFIPAALNRAFGVFLTGLFVQGMGLSLLQTASNPYITIIGPHKSAARRISIMGICNKVAGAISPLVLGFIILNNTDAVSEALQVLTGMERTLMLDAMAHKVILPYVVMAIVLSGLAIMVRFAPLPDVEPEDSSETSKASFSLFKYPHLVLGFWAIFGYVGVEVLAGDSIVLYGQSQGIALSVARKFTSYTLVAMIVGYVIGIVLIPRFITQSKALAYSAVLGVAFSAAAIFTSGYLSVIFIALLGLANALMWPAIWPLAISDLGKFTKNGSAILIMGIAGGAIFPPLYGKITELIGAQTAYIIMLPVYIYILWYSVKGYKLR
jgi:MFS transporter, FHS family, L-fucose permease